MESKKTKGVRCSNQYFVCSLCIIALFVGIFFLAFCNLSSDSETSIVSETTSNKDITEAGSLCSVEEQVAADEFNLDSVSGVYVAGYNDFEVLSNGIYTKLNLIDEGYITDEEMARVINLLALMAIKLDNETSGSYYNIQPAITDLYGGSKEVNLKPITEFYNYSEPEIINSEIIIDKTTITINDNVITAQSDLLPAGSKLEIAGDGKIILTIPQYQEKITLHKANIKIE